MKKSIFKSRLFDFGDLNEFSLTNKILDLETSLMKEKFHKFKASWFYYVFQSLIATHSIFIVLLILKFSNAIVIASIGATAFIVFAMPNSLTALPPLFFLPWELQDWKCFSLR